MCTKDILNLNFYQTVIHKISFFYGVAPHTYSQIVILQVLKMDKPTGSTLPTSISEDIVNKLVI